MDMESKKPLLFLAVLAVAALVVFAVDAYEKQAADKVIRFQLESTDPETLEMETQEVVVYDQEDVAEIEDKLRELGYIE